MPSKSSEEVFDVPNNYVEPEAENEEIDNIESLRAELAAAKAENEKIQSALVAERMKAAKLKQCSTPKGELDSRLGSVPGVDYTKHWCFVKWHTLNEFNKLVLAHGEYSSPEGKVFVFDRGYCVSNDVDGLKHFLIGKGKWQINQFNRHLSR